MFQAVRCEHRIHARDVLHVPSRGYSAGRYSTESSASTVDVCLACPPGTSSSTGASSASSCQDYASGKYAEAVGTCTLCDSGRYSTESGASTIKCCLACPLGRASAAVASTCANCTLGEYAEAAACEALMSGAGARVAGGWTSCALAIPLMMVAATF